MADNGSVSEWIAEIQRGNEESIPLLWERYFPELVRVARDALRLTHDRMATGEDVALSAFDSFVEAMRSGRFQRLEDRHDLWRLLSEMTRRKAVDLIRRGLRAKRGGGNVRGESALRAGGGSGVEAWGGIACDDPTPSLALMLAEDCEHLLELLSPPLRDLALRKLEGHTNREIAAELGCSVATVERRLAIVRQRWREVAPPIRR